jgi:FkbM family methyltransferase
MRTLQQLVSWPFGSRLAFHKGVVIDLSSPIYSEKIKRNIRKGVYEANEARAAKALVQPGQTVLEIGAGCGFLSCYIAKLGRNNTLHCVEANPRLISVIKRQHQLNRVTAHVHNELLTDAEGEADFYLHRDFWASMSKPWEGAEKVTVKKTRFRDRLLEWRPDCVIMDIEGAELELVELGLPEFVRTLIVEIHEFVYGPEGVKRVMDRMSELGFAYVSAASQKSVLSYSRF